MTCHADEPQGGQSGSSPGSPGPWSCHTHVKRRAWTGAHNSLTRESNTLDCSRQTSSHNVLAWAHHTLDWFTQWPCKGMLCGGPAMACVSARAEDEHALAHLGHGLRHHRGVHAGHAPHGAHHLLHLRTRPRMTKRQSWTLGMNSKQRMRSPVHSLAHEWARAARRHGGLPHAARRRMLHAGQHLLLPGSTHPQRTTLTQTKSTHTAHSTHPRHTHPM
eukprot:364866-Chlamydomonas_euryale.AAC.9